SKVTRGSTLVDMARPLTLRLILTGAGPWAGTLLPPAPPAAWVVGGATGTPVSAVAAAAAPEPRKNCRRDRPLADSLVSLMMSSRGWAGDYLPQRIVRGERAKHKKFVGRICGITGGRCLPYSARAAL